MRISVAVAVACLSIISISVAEDARASFRKPTHIPPQNLGSALQALAKDRDVQVVYFSKSIDSLESHGAQGDLTMAEALSLLLSGTNLTYRYLDDKTVTVMPAPTTPPSKPSASVSSRESGVSFWGRLRLAQTAAAEPAEAGTSSQDAKLEEIVVTANRREQRSQDVAGGLQVFSGADLDRRGASQFSDYLLTIPGVSFRDQGAGSRRIALRGVSNFAGSDNGITSPTSTTGLYLNDISIADTSNVPDLALYDLDRIEALNGPQGTLYGEGAMGGAIKMVLKSPNLTRFEARGETALSGTEGGGFNYQVRGLANLPLVADKMALRLVGSYDHQDGFIDNLADGHDDFNGARAYSLRAQFLAQLSDRFSAEVLALRNVQNQGAFDQVDINLPDLSIRSVENVFNDAENSVVGLTLNYDFGLARLTSISSYYNSKRDQLVRVPVLASPVFGQFGAVTQDPIAFDIDLDSVSQELRLVSSGDHRLDWVFGAFYRDKKQDSVGDLFIAPGDLASVNEGLATAGLLLLPDSGTYLGSTTQDGYEQYAAYGEINFQLIDRLELILGLRWFDEKVSFDAVTNGYSVLAAASSVDDESFSDDGVIPKLGVSYQISPDHKLYAQAAKGFRSGIININRSFGVGGIAAKSDNLWNYEVGAKTSWADGRLRLNGSVFYVDWKDVQTIQTEISPVSGTPIGFFGNGGDAELIGVELEAMAAPSSAILLGATIGYTHGELVHAEADAIQGARLPNVPKWNAAGFLELHRQMTSDALGFVRFEVQYTDRQATRPITTASDGVFVDAYALGKVQLGVESSTWSASLFIDNLWDERAQFGRGITGAGPIFNLERVTIARPRTYGVRLGWQF